MKWVRGWVGVAVVLLVVLAAQACLAQKPVTLEYKFTPGQKLNYAINFTADMTMNPTPPGMPPGLMTMDGTMNLVQRTAQVNPDGSATLGMSLPAMNMNMLMAGQKAKMFLGNGKITIVFNGQPQSIPLGDNISQIPLIGKPINITMTKQGKVTGFDMTGMDFLKQYMGNLDLSELMKANQNELPDHPIQVGEKWTVSENTPIPGSNQSIPSQTTYKFVGFETIGGEQTAKIAITSTTKASGIKIAAPSGATPANMPSMNIDNMAVNVNGTTWFSMARGQMVRTQLAMKIKEAFTMPDMSGQGGDPQKMSLGMNMNIGMTLK